jgi:hypothetical protein
MRKLMSAALSVLTPHRLHVCTSCQGMWADLMAGGRALVVHDHEGARAWGRGIPATEVRDVESLQAVGESHRKSWMRSWDGRHVWLWEASYHERSCPRTLPCKRLQGIGGRLALTEKSHLLVRASSRRCDRACRRCMFLTCRTSLPPHHSS